VILDHVWPRQSERDTYYGDPRGKNGQPSVQWEIANLVNVPTPWALYTAWTTPAGNRTKIGKGVRVHKKCARSLVRVFEAIWKAARYDQRTIEAWGMHLLGGGYTFRLTRGGSSLSSHSWGCAIDFDPERNQMGDATPNFANVPEVLKAFADEGWEWGGNWSRPDGMHWQAART
jgi:hypothetical protein